LRSRITSAGSRSRVESTPPGRSRRLHAPVARRSAGSRDECRNRGLVLDDEDRGGSSSPARASAWLCGWRLECEPLRLRGNGMHVNGSALQSHARRARVHTDVVTSEARLAVEHDGALAPRPTRRCRSRARRSCSRLRACR
jgi:hypothetical protein